MFSFTLKACVSEIRTFELLKLLRMLIKFNNSFDETCNKILSNLFK